MIKRQFKSHKFDVEIKTDSITDGILFYSKKVLGKENSYFHVQILKFIRFDIPIKNKE